MPGLFIYISARSMYRAVLGNVGSFRFRLMSLSIIDESSKVLYNKLSPRGSNTALCTRATVFSADNPAALCCLRAAVDRRSRPGYARGGT